MKMNLGKALSCAATGLAAALTMFSSYEPMTPVSGGSAPVVGSVEQEALRRELRAMLFSVGGRAAFGAEGGEGSAECNSKASDVGTKYQEKQQYLHGALNYFNGSLFMLNKVFTSGPETALCHFNKSMGMNPSKDALPVTIEKTFGSKTVKLEVVEPSESWAQGLGYDAKGTVSVDGSTFMVLYWGGEDDKSKGFMIEGPDGMGGGGGNKHMMYIQWDRTDQDAQFVKVLGGMFTTSYLGSAGGSGSDKSSPFNGDRGIFGKATYNATTKAVTAQVVLLENQRQGGSSGSFGCFKMFASGTKGGTVTVAKTQNSLSGSGHGVNSTATDSTEMDGVELADSVSTANGTGTQLNSSQLSSLVAFSKSCYDVNNAASAGKPFVGNTVNFSASPTDIFP